MKNISYQFHELKSYISCSHLATCYYRVHDKIIVSTFHRQVNIGNFNRLVCSANKVEILTNLQLINYTVGRIRKDDYTECMIHFTQ